MSKLTLRGRLKATAVVCKRLLSSPSTRRDDFKPSSLMKPIPLTLFAALATMARVPAQGEPTGVSLESTTTARILGKIADGTPPPPEPPKPNFIVQAKDILATTTHQQGGRAITIRKIKPLALPPPPAPVVPVVAEADAEFSQRLAEYREAHPKSELLFLGATVFRSKDSPPRTLVRCWPQGKGRDITFWSSADFALIAGGINSFVDSAADTHYLVMGWGNVDIDRMSDLQASKGHKYDAPDMPDFPEGKATFAIIGEQPTAADRLPIQSLHDLYNREYARLRTAYEGRKKASIEREASLKAHPPQPQDITLNYWHTERPAAKKGAAR